MNFAKLSAERILNATNHILIIVNCKIRRILPC